LEAKREASGMAVGSRILLLVVALLLPVAVITFSTMADESSERLARWKDRVRLFVVERE